MLSRRAASLWLTISAAVGVTSALQLPDVINRDVVIIGGGASGAYAAVRLRDDYGKSIALVEMREGLVSKKDPHRPLVTRSPHWVSGTNTAA